MEKPDGRDISNRSFILKANWAQWDSLHVQNGILKRKWERPDEKSSIMQLIVPYVGLYVGKFRMLNETSYVCDAIGYFAVFGKSFAKMLPKWFTG